MLISIHKSSWSSFVFINFQVYFSYLLSPFIPYVSFLFIQIKENTQARARWQIKLVQKGNTIHKKQQHANILVKLLLESSRKRDECITLSSWDVWKCNWELVFCFLKSIWWESGICNGWGEMNFVLSKITAPRHVKAGQWYITKA